MEQFYSLASEFNFSFLSVAHVTALLLILALNVAIYFSRDKIDTKKRNVCRITLVLLLIFQELALQAWEISTGIWSIENSLPLQLCGMSLLLTAIMLLTKNENIYQVVYFWGIAGASQALLTPDINYGFPHFVFLQFFTAHGLIVTGCLWMTFMEGYRPNLASLVKAFVVINLYAIIVGAFNYLTGSNYLYLRSKPANASLLNYLGEWPWYIVSLEVVALAMFFLSALPFLWSEIAALRREKGSKWSA